MSGCDRFEDLLAKYMHGQSLLQEKEDLECHLAVCAACERRYREIADVDRILRQAPRKLEDPPPYLRGKILANLPEVERSPAWRRWGRWAAAAGTAAACILAIAVFFDGTVQKQSRVASPPSATLPAAQPPGTAPEGTVTVPDVRPPLPTVTAPTINPPAVKVRVISEVKIFFYYPAATKVAVIGDFNGWAPEGVPMTQSGKPGLWKTTLLLKPGAYSYNFIVDGNLLLPDPSAPDQMPDGYGGTNSILLVKGGNPA